MMRDVDVPSIEFKNLPPFAKGGGFAKTIIDGFLPGKRCNITEYVSLFTSPDRRLPFPKKDMAAKLTKAAFDFGWQDQSREIPFPLAR
jgi:hypothetical protein